MRVHKSWGSSLGMVALVSAPVMFAITVGGDMPIGLLLLWAVLLVLEFGYLRWQGFTLTTDEVRVHNVRTRRVPWARIQAVTTERTLGTRQIVLWTDDGTRVALHTPAITNGFGRARQAACFELLGQAWLERRGPEWRQLWAAPAPGVTPHPDTGINPWAPPQV